MRQANRTLRWAAFLLPSFLVSCIWLDGDSRVFVFSEPSGAKISVDGTATGKTTPAILDLGGLFGSSHEIELSKTGYEPEKRRVSHFTVWGTSRLRDGVSDIILPPLPVWWTVGDMLFPLEARWIYVPHNLFVKMFPEGTFKPQPIRETIGKHPPQAGTAVVASGESGENE